MPLLPATSALVVDSALVLSATNPAAGLAMCELMSMQGQEIHTVDIEGLLRENEEDVRVRVESPVSAPAPLSSMAARPPALWTHPNLDILLSRAEKRAVPPPALSPVQALAAARFPGGRRAA